VYGRAVQPLAISNGIVWAAGWDNAATRLISVTGVVDLGAGSPVSQALDAAGQRAAITVESASGYRLVDVDLASRSQATLATAERYARAVAGDGAWIAGHQPGALATLPGVPLRVLPSGSEWDVPVVSLPSGDALIAVRSRGSGGRDVRDQRSVVVQPDGTLVTSLPADWTVIGSRQAPAQPDRPLAIDVRPSAVQACATVTGQALQPNVSDLQAAFRMASLNQGPGGYPSIEQVESNASGSARQAPRLSTALLGAIGWVESGWSQARNTARGSLGPTLQSFDCGFGVMQVTSGMYAGTLDPAIQQRIGTDYLYNVLWGSNILVQKWNYAESGFFKYIGDRNPCVVENWYYATMAYNGVASKNNPNNPSYDRNRPIFNGTQPRGNYPYQELVWGLMRNPPSISGARLWNPVNVAYPPDAWFPATDFPNALQNLSRITPETLSDACGGPGSLATPTPSPTPTPTFTPTPTPTPFPCYRTNPPAAAPTPLPFRDHIVFVPSRCSSFAGW
jgi:hypothetical protein